MAFQFSHLFIQPAFFEHLLCARSHARHCKYYRTINKTGSCPCLHSTYSPAGKTTKTTQKELHLMVHRPRWGLHSMLSTRAFPIKIWISNFSLQLRKKMARVGMNSPAATLVELRNGYSFRKAFTLQFTTTPNYLIQCQFHPFALPVLHPNTSELKTLV